MSNKSHQIIRSGSASWMIWRIEDREYEQIARVVLEDGAYYVELPLWGDDGIDEWQRQPRPWTLKEGAVRSVTHPKKAMAS